MNGQSIADEVQRFTGCDPRTAGKGTFIIDIGMFLPHFYEDICDACVLTVSCVCGNQVYTISNTADSHDGGVVNHRYPNRNYYTLSQRKGKKICRIGCVIQTDLDTLRQCSIVTLTYGLLSFTITVNIPVLLPLTVDKPAAAMSVKINQNGQLTFRVYERLDEMCWNESIYFTSKTAYEDYLAEFPLCGENTHFLKTIPIKQDGQVILDKPILLKPDTIDNLMIV